VQSFDRDFLFDSNSTFLQLNQAIRAHQHAWIEVL